MSETPRGTLLGPGDEIDGFVIEAVAGRGGMRVVCRARPQRPDRVVAPKVIAPDVAGDAALRTRFELESSIAARIEHPNVIPVCANRRCAGHPLRPRDRARGAMRFVDGTDLRSLLADVGSLPPSRAAAIVDGVGRVLDAAHAHGLVHRDVKPANILLAAVGGHDHVYLTDFGLSRHIQSTSGPTRTGAFLGTIHYFTPEQARGERVDARADIYSLGCVLFTVLTGSVPFEAGTGADPEAAILEGNVTANPSFEDDLSSWDHFNGDLTRIADSHAPDGTYVARVAPTGPETEYPIDGSGVQPGEAFLVDAITLTEGPAPQPSPDCEL